MAYFYTMRGATKKLARGFRGEPGAEKFLANVNEKGEFKYTSDGHSIITKNSDGNSIPLDTLFSPQALKNFFNMNSSVLKNSDDTMPLKTRIGKDYAEVVFRRVGVERSLIDTEDLYNMNFSDINHADVDTFSVAANVSKSIAPISLETIDFSQMNAAASLSNLITESIQKTLTSYIIQRAHYTLDAAAIAAGNRTEWDLNTVTGDEIFQAIKTTAYAITRLVSKHSIGIPKEKIVIEMAEPVKDILVKAEQFKDQRNAGGNAYDVKTGELKGIDGYKVEIDSTMPEGVYMRIRIPETLKALFVLERANTGRNEITTDPFITVSIREGMTADWLDALFIWTATGYTPVNPKDATRTPTWNNPSPQTANKQTLVQQVENNAANITVNATNITTNMDAIADHETRITALETTNIKAYVEAKSIAEYIGFEINKDTTVGDLAEALTKAKAKMSKTELMAFVSRMKKTIPSRIKNVTVEAKQEVSEAKAEEAKQEAEAEVNKDKLFNEVKKEFESQGLLKGLNKNEIKAKVWEEVNKRLAQ